MEQRADVPVRGGHLVFQHCDVRLHLVDVSVQLRNPWLWLGSWGAALAVAHEADTVPTACPPTTRRIILATELAMLIHWRRNLANMATGSAYFGV